MIENHRPATEHAKVNTFAIRCFRDTGDMDYIAARLAIRAWLPQPFLWSASQAVEKYLKCILILNRVETSGLSHDLDKALKRVNERLPFSIDLPPGERAVFDHLADWNGDRYLIASFELDNYELFQLDALVWRLRQYCTALNKHHYADEPSEAVMEEKLVKLRATIAGPSKAAGRLQGGVLEDILGKRHHPSHGALTWQNGFYGRSERKSIRYRPSWSAVNAPLFIYPELVDEVAKWMHIPGPVQEGARQLARQKARKKNNPK